MENNRRYLLLIQLFTICIVLTAPIGAYCQPGGTVASQHFVMQVDDMMDLGYVNENKDYTKTSAYDLKDMEDGLIPEFKFRIRTNEPYQLSLSTISADSSGNEQADSILQVKIAHNGKGKDDDKQPYQDLSRNPETILDNTKESLDETLTLKYRTKPGAVIPPTIKKVDVILTASYP